MSALPPPSPISHFCGAAAARPQWNNIMCNSRNSFAVTFSRHEPALTRLGTVNGLVQALGSAGRACGRSTESVCAAANGTRRRGYAGPKLVQKRRIFTFGARHILGFRSRWLSDRTRLKRDRDLPKIRTWPPSRRNWIDDCRRRRFSWAIRKQRFTSANDPPQPFGDHRSANGIIIVTTITRSGGRYASAAHSFRTATRPVRARREDVVCPTVVDWNRGGGESCLFGSSSSAGWRSWLGFFILRIEFMVIIHSFLRC